MIYLNDAAAVGNLQDVEPMPPLLRGQRLSARAERHETIAFGLVDESVDLVGIDGRGNGIARLNERHLEVGCRNLQQPLQRLEQLRASDLRHGISLAWLARVGERIVDT